MSQEFKTIIYPALCACFGMNPSSAAASVLIREAYLEPENAPRPPRNADVVYYSIAPDPAAREAPAVYSEENAAQGFHAAAVSSFPPGRCRSSAMARMPSGTPGRSGSSCTWTVRDSRGAFCGRPDCIRCRIRRSPCCSMNRRAPSGGRGRT